MIRIVKRIAFILLILAIPMFILPNLLNDRERLHYSDEERLNEAKKQYRQESLNEKISIIPAPYYADKSKAHLYFFGNKYRDIWNTEIEVPVFSLRDSIQFHCEEIGGGDQTISLELDDSKGRVWTLRSIDKDQSKALPGFLQTSIIRPIVRDEVAAMNPYGAFVAARLAEELDIFHTHPKLVFVPYIEEMKEECALKMAGRVALLEEEYDKGQWQNTYQQFDKFLDTEDMVEALEDNENLAIDTLQYLKARLLDILIADWDRHEGQWVWGKKGNVYQPIPIDRDMTFYLFDDGWLNKIVLVFNNKFRSFHPEYDDITGYIANSKALDEKILRGISEEKFIEVAGQVKRALDEESITEAVKAYPSPIYEKLSENQITILLSRLSKIEMAAREFHAAIHN